MLVNRQREDVFWDDSQSRVSRHLGRQQWFYSAEYPDLPLQIFNGVVVPEEATVPVFNTAYITTHFCDTFGSGICAPTTDKRFIHTDKNRGYCEQRFINTD